MGLGLVGAGLTAFGQFGQAEMQANAAAYQAQVANANAQLAARAETQTGQAMETAGAQLGMQERAKIGQQKVAFGASGVDAGSGTAAQVIRGMDFAARLNQQTQRAKYGQQAATQQAAVYSNLAQAGLDQYTASTLPILGGIQAGGTLLSGFGKYGIPFA